VGQLLGLARVVTFLARPTRLQGGGLTFRPGGTSEVGVAAVAYKWLALCSLGCGWLSRAESWLKYERLYIGMTVLEGGVGSLLGMAEHLDVGAVAHNFDSVEGNDLVLCVRQGCPRCWSSASLWRGSLEG
jgi:hypothetical protein